MNETLLYIMYNYRKSAYHEVVLLLLEKTLEAVSSEETGTLLDFLLSTVGPSYTCRRYWDWFEPFILQNIQENVVSVVAISA